MIQDQNTLKLPHLVSLSTSDLTFSSRHSPAAVICAFLIAKKGFTSFQLSQVLGLPPLVIEECIRNDVSSTFLRNQLAKWLDGSENAVMHGIPSSLIVALRETSPTGKVEIPNVYHDSHKKTLPSETNGSSVKDMPDPAQHDRTFSVFTPFSAQHFKSLQSSVGQSFISILNDPGEFTESADWGTWLSGKLYEAFDYNGHFSNNLEGPYKSLYHQQSSQKSSSLLFIEHILRRDYNDYVNLVSAAYHANRSEGRKTIDTLSFIQGDAQRAEDLPWPVMVPEDFFSITYAPQTILRRLFSAPSDGSAESAIMHSKTEDAKVERADEQKLICADTFAKDLEVLEEFGKELGMWETSVENCLLQHVRSHSGNFFRESRDFSLLSGKSRCALKELSHARDVGGARITKTIHQYLSIGRLYRRKNNIESLSSLLSCVQRVRQLLQDIENWTALPEREIAELPAYVHRLLDLEGTFRDTITTFASKNKPEARKERVEEEGRAGGVSSSQASLRPNTMSPDPGLNSLESITRLNFMAPVPSRIAAVRRDLEQLLCSEVSLGLQGAGAESSSVPVAELSRVVNAAALMDVLPHALRNHRELRLQAQWKAVRETVLNFLINRDGCLSNVKADRLLSLAIPLEPTVEERKSLLMYCAECPFDLFIQLLEGLVEVLVESLTQNAQSWGYFILECALDALVMYDNKHELLTRWTLDLFSALCEDAESVIAIYLELRFDGKVHTNIAEVERLVSVGNGFIARILHPLSVLSSLHSEVLHKLVDRIRVGKQIGVVALNLAKHSLKTQHTQQTEKLKLVLEAETWVSKADIDAFFQLQLERLCSSDNRAVKDFFPQSIEIAKTGYTVVEWDAVMAAASDNSQVLCQVAISPVKTIKDEEETAFNTRANRLYFSLNEEDDGRVASNSLLILLELLANYDSYLARFPSLGMDVASKMYELLALYDSLCASMVLGAQATRNDVLTNITTLHLCVASQCVAFLADFTPRLKQRLARLLGEANGETTASRMQSDSEKMQVGTVVLPRGSRATNKLLNFIENDFTRVIKDCQAHRNDFFDKIISIVLEKINYIEIVGGETKGYNARGIEWIMTMLREVARLIRSLRPLLPPSDLQGIVVPLLGSLTIKIREVTKPIPASDVDTLSIAKSDVLLYKANVERFGYDVLRSVEARSVNAAMQFTDLGPRSSDEEVLAWFFSDTVGEDT